VQFISTHKNTVNSTTTSCSRPEARAPTTWRARRDRPRARCQHRGRRARRAHRLRTPSESLEKVFGDGAESLEQVVRANGIGFRMPDGGRGRPRRSNRNGSPRRQNEGNIMGHSDKTCSATPRPAGPEHRHPQPLRPVAPSGGGQRAGGADGWAKDRAVA
jgi:hypothetical protein